MIVVVVYRSKIGSPDVRLSERLSAFFFLQSVGLLSISLTGYLEIDFIAAFNKIVPAKIFRADPTVLPRAGETSLGSRDSLAFWRKTRDLSIPSDASREKNL